MKVLFYLISSRGTKRYEVLNIAQRTLNNKTAMHDFLVAWAKKSNCWDSSENHITYGYEAPTKVNRFVLAARSTWRYSAKPSLVSRLLSKTAALALKKKKVKLQEWFEKRGVNMFLKQYELIEIK